MKLGIIVALALFISLAFADDPITNLTAGTCQSYQFFNTTTNLTDNWTFCAPNATNIINTTYGCFNLSITLNASNASGNSYSDSSCNLTVSAIGNTTTIVQNVQNITIVSGCSATSATIAPGGSFSGNNATITCTACPANSGVCNFADTITPGASDIYENNVSGLAIHILGIPSTYCYENITQTYTSSAVWTSPRCNDIITCNPPINNGGCPEGTYCQYPQQACPQCQQCTQCQTCPNPITCPPPETCPPVMLSVSPGQTASIGNTSATCLACPYQAPCLPDNSSAVAISAANNVDNSVEIGLLVVIGGFILWLFKIRTSATPTKYGKVVSAEEIERLVPKKKED